ncbi:MAG TPA: FTR1 family protein, partial [Acidobacteriota bacterium]|nr:FTR1 family protein [Acidobacteriota bacterium]
MIAALIIVFREIIEAGIVVGIVLAATRGVARRSLWVAYGILGGAAGACLVAVFAGAISSAFAGSGQELFNAAILLFAVVMLAWHNVWMSRHGREISAAVRSVGEAVAAGSRTMAALATVVGIAVLREGSEVVLFLFGIAVSSKDSALAMTAGSLAGVLL